MKIKKRAAIAVVTVTLIGVVSLVVYSIYTSTPNNPISGKVISLVNRPNMAEDGYRGFTVEDAKSHQYTVNATGYLNTPLSPEDRGEACIDIPAVHEGDVVTFNLPKSEYSDSYLTCYPSKISGYYFRVTNQ